LPAPIIVLIDVVIVIVAVVLLLRVLGLEIGGLR
jgi:hypothetical protein